MSYYSKCMALCISEEIVHTATMGKWRVSDKGLIDLAHRSGEFKTIYAKEVYENDEFEYEFGLEPKLVHKPSTDVHKGAVRFYYAVYTLVNGGFGFEVMSREEVESHAKKYSKAYSRGPWVTNFDEMAKKTLIKKLIKYAPIKTEFVRQMVEDNTVTRAEKKGDNMTFSSEDITYVEADVKGEVIESE